MLRTINRPTRVIHVSTRTFTVQCRKFSIQRPEDSEKREQSRDENHQASTSTPQAPVDIQWIRERVRNWGIRRASALRVRMDDFSARAKVTFQQLGGRVNEVTGYNEIEALKNLVAENERRMNEIREEAKAAKVAYEEAVARRSNSQRETNELLQRKSTWSDADVLRFTQLVRADHAYEQEEAQAQARVDGVDAAVERQFSELMRAILSRYHEEQVWSDKIRSASTYGSLAALGLNLVVFILAIVLVEPWKRKRLVQSFERRVIELNEANQRVVEDGLRELRVHQEEQEKILNEIKEEQGSKAERVRVVAPGEELEAVETIPPAEFERNAKTARDRQLVALSIASTVGAGIVGFIVGSYFN